MKRTVNVLLAVFVMASTLLPATMVMAQTGSTGTQSDASEVKGNKPGEFHMYHIVILRKGPNWKSQNTTAGMDARMDAIDRIKKGAQEGIIVAAGLVNDETDGEFILLLDVETKTEALAIAKKSPMLTSGFYKADIYSWFATSTVKGE